MDPETSLVQKGKTPTGELPSRGESARVSRFPDRLMQDTPRRLGWVALLYAGCYTLAHTVGSTSGLYEGLGFSPAHGTAAAAILVSLLVFWISRSRLLSPERTNDFGLLYQVVGAFGIDAYLTWIPIDQSFLPIGISWVGVWIVCFVVIVPSTPGKTLLASLAAASATPLLLLVGMARATADPSGTAIVQLCFPNYVCALVAVAGSHIIYQLRSEVAEARQLGSYKLIELLGHGGMGEVWRATHRMLARPAAIKLISPELIGHSRGASSTLFRRFRQEAKATANLNSIHTITVYDYGVSDQGKFFYVMELLNGLDLEQLVKRFGPLPTSRVIYLLHQICHSLSDAHEHGLIHRDVKPANVYCCRIGSDYDFIKVLDFGLLKHDSSQQHDMTQLTQVGVATGTPSYMSPETARGSELDARSDIYSLGCVAVWLLAGKPLFQAKTPVEMMMHHLQTEPPRVSELAEQEIPGTLESIVLDCLSKEPDRRPATMQDLGRRLERVEPGDSWDPSQAREWWSTHLPDLAG